MKGENQTKEAEQINKKNISEEMEDSYISYAMSVIVKRALPDVRDGLKPVQRRILYTMFENRITHTKSHRKCSNIVGDTMGDYHPHGDKSIYDSLSRMAQDFSMGKVLVDGQGNFGSIDGDSPAAMRYTEARLSEMGEELVKDIDDGTVDWDKTYDGRKEEPQVLPSKYPNLLVNGSSGIAVGMSTNIPPHNLNEVIDATVHYIKNKNCDVESLLDYVKGPDFPTGGKIVKSDDLKKAYTEGKGKVTIRPSYEMEEDRIVITEIPYKKNKSKIVKKIADLVNSGDIEGIKDLRDQSDSGGVEIVIELKDKAVNEVVEKTLLDKVLEVKSFSIRNIALVGNKPKKLNLKEILAEFVKHRKEVVRRRTQNEFDEKSKKLKVLNAKLVAIENVEDFIQKIRDSENRSEAKDKIVLNYELDEEQAESIVRMQLGSLTSLEIDEVTKEKEKIESRISRLEEILNDEDELDQIIIDELNKIKEKHGNERKTDIITDYNEVTKKDLIPEEELVVLLTDNNYIKSINREEFRQQRRGGKGVNSIRFKNGDSAKDSISCTTHDTIAFMTNKDNIYTIKGYNIPQKSRNSQGTPLVRVLEKLDEDEEVITVDNLNNLEEHDYVIQVTEKGRVKKTKTEEYNNIYESGIKGINTNQDDTLIKQVLCNSGEDILITSEEGKIIRFNEKEVRSTNRNSKGVKGMETEKVCSVTVIDSEKDILFVKDNGVGKRTKVKEFNTQSRAGKGSIGIKLSDGDSLNSVCKGNKGDDLFVLTRKGKILRTEYSEIPISSRNTKGARIISLDEDDEIVNVKTSSSHSP